MGEQVSHLDYIPMWENKSENRRRDLHINLACESKKPAKVRSSLLALKKVGNILNHTSPVIPIDEISTMSRVRVISNGCRFCGCFKVLDNQLCWNKKIIP